MLIALVVVYALIVGVSPGLVLLGTAMAVMAVDPYGLGFWAAARRDADTVAR